MDVIYLDNNATTRPADEVVDAMAAALCDLWANPSSVHRAGQRVRQQVDLAREQVCRLINCQPRELVFTSGGTESTNLAIHGSLQAQARRRLVITDRLEHSATRETAEALEQRGVEVCWLPLDAYGLIDCNALSDVLKDRDEEVAVVSVQWANNETGAIQPIESIGSLCREHGVRLHCDATQWVGKMPTDVAELPIDLMTFSAHKFHGPKGIGALFVRRGVRLSAAITGGPQERQRRGGTENVPGIIGMGKAAELASEWLDTAGTPDAPAAQGELWKSRDELRTLRDRFEEHVLSRVDDAVINAANVPRLWNTSNIAFPRLEAEAILLLLSERGVCASAGAACSSGSLDPSPVLLAMGVPEELAHGSVRFSISRETTEEEITGASDTVASVVGRLRSSITAV